MSSTTLEDSFTQLFALTCKIIVSEHFCNNGHRLWCISSADAPGKGRTFTGYFFDNLFPSIPDIIESPVIKIVFRDHLWIWSLLVGVMTEDWFEGDEVVVSISVSEVVGIKFFSGIGILECLYFWWCFLRTFFIWESMWALCFEMVPLVSLLLGSVSASFYWECLGRFMLYSMKARPWWSSAGEWQLRCVDIFWRSSKSWESLEVVVLYLVRYDTLFQNVTDIITKYDG